MSIPLSVDLATLSQAPIQEPIPEDVFKQALQQSPFIPIDKALNLRDLGASTPAFVRRGLIFRSGTLSPLHLESLQRLHTDLHICCIFDLRSQRETEFDPIPDIRGIERVWLAPAKAPDAVDIAQFAGNGGARGYSIMYLDVLAVFEPTIKAIFEHLRDRSEEAILFHCNGKRRSNIYHRSGQPADSSTAGKDRTGVVAAMILALAGVPHSTIASEYVLTRIGIEPERERLESNFAQAFGKIDHGKPGITEICGLYPEAMIGFLNAMEEKFGDAGSYLKSKFGFSDEDVEKIKNNLVG